MLHDAFEPFQEYFAEDDREANIKKISDIEVSLDEFLKVIRTDFKGVFLRVDFLIETKQTVRSVCLWSLHGNQTMVSNMFLKILAHYSSIERYFSQNYQLKDHASISSPHPSQMFKNFRWTKHN